MQMVGFSDLPMDRIMLDGIVNPWYDVVPEYALSVILLGAFFTWIQARVNNSKIYEVLSNGLVINGAILLWWGKDPNPNPIVMVVYLLSTLAVVAAVAAIFTVLVVLYLPDLGLPEKWVQEPNDHRVRYFVPFLPTFFALIVFWLACMTPFVLFRKVLGDFQPWLVALLSVIGTSITAYGILPMHSVRETAFMGETTPPQELDDIFVSTGDAQSMEKFTVPLLTLAMWGVLLYFVAHGGDLATQDTFGLFFLIALGLSIVATEWSRYKNAKEYAALVSNQPPPAPPNGIWNKGSQ